MASEHPFQVLFETLGRVPVAHAEPVNRQAYDLLSDILAVPVERSGRCILLRAPRAGHGKTHLLSRIQHHLGASHEFVPLQAASGCRIDAASVTDDTLRRLVRQLPASGGLTALDLVSRRLFASALQPLVASGEVPCQDREGALTALRNRPIETFDFHHPNAVTAHWARENFEVLGQRLSLELSHRVNLPVGAVSFWVDVLFHFASAPLESSNRVRILAEAAHGGGGVGMERLEALLGLLTLLMRVVLVADDLEGFSTDETAALRLAAFLGSLRQSVERLDVILSLNRDIWESAFVPRLSGWLADRLSEVVVELEPLTETEMEALLESRVPGLGRRVLERIDLSSSGTHARGLIRAAGMAWLKASAADSASPPVVVAAVVAPAPPMVVDSGPMADLAPVVPEPAVEAPPVSVSSPFSFAAAQEEVETRTGWPAPVFSPPVVEELLPEPVFVSNPAESPFHAVAALEAKVSSPAQGVSGWQESPPAIEPQEPVPVVESSWNPPAPMMEATPDSPTFEPQLDSPFQVAARQIVPEPPVPPFESVGWQESGAPLTAASTLEDFIVPVQGDAPPSFPYENAPPQFVPESASYPSVSWQPSSPPPPPPQGIFVAPPDDQTTPEPVSFSPEPPQDFRVSGASSNFVNEPSPAFPIDAEPAFNPPATVADAAAPPSATDTDRVDELLRQFRERYGRGSL
ncbi:MAG: hypothetical protein ACRCXD_07225 [Luteolibacter sp.]